MARDKAGLRLDCPNSGLIIGMDLYVHKARRPQRFCRPRLAGVYEVGWSKEDTMNAFLKREQCPGVALQSQPAFHNRQLKSIRFDIKQHCGKS